MEKKTAIKWHIGLFFSAVIVRILFLAVFGGTGNRIYDSMSDQYIYLDIANNLVSKGQFMVSTDTWVADASEPTSIVPPLYPLFLAGVFYLFGQHLIIVRLLHILFSALMVNLVFVIGQSTFNDKTAILASILTVFYPPLVMYVRPIMSEGLFYPLILLLVWTTYKLDQIKPSKMYYVLWGLTAALSILTRTEILFLIALSLVYLIYKQFKRKQKVNLFDFSAMAVTGFVILLPYIMYNYSMHGNLSFLPNAKWKLWDHTYWTEMQNRPEWEETILPERKIVPDWETRTEVERDNYLWQMAFDFIRSNPKTFFIQRIKHLVWGYPVIPRELFAQDTEPPDWFEYGPTSLDDVVRYITVAEQIRVWAFRLIFVLAVCGMYITLKYRHSSAYFLLLVIAWNIFHIMLFVGSERLRIQIDSFLTIFAASFLVYVIPQIRKRQVKFPPAPPQARPQPARNGRRTADRRC